MADSKSITMKDVAREAGVALGTVSKVVNGIPMGKTYQRRVEDAIDRYTGPVLIVHGDRDEAVPVEYGIRAAERYKDCKLVLIPGDTHCYDYHLDQVLDAVREWMQGR